MANFDYGLEGIILDDLKCLEKMENRICSRCRRGGMERTPAFYRLDDSTSVYLCDECYDICHDKHWIPFQLQGVFRIPYEIAKSIVVKQKMLKL
jgi:hypothetical protein